MEQLSFKRILGILSYAKAQLPILPTIFFLDHKNVKFRSGPSQRVFHQSLIQERIQQYLKKLAAHHQHIQKLKLRNYVICYMEEKGNKKGIKKKDLEGNFNSVSGAKYIQFPISSEQHVFLVFGLMYSSLGYTTNLNYCKDNSQCNLSDVFQKAADISKVLINLIEKSSQKKVLVLNIELALINSEILYFSGIRTAKVYPADQLVKQNIRDKQDIERLMKKGKQLTLPATEGVKSKSQRPRIQTDFSVPILPLEEQLYLPQIKRKSIRSPTALMKFHQAKMSQPSAISNHFLELVSKTNVKLRSKYRSYHDEDIRREVARIFGMMNKQKAVQKPAIVTKQTANNQPFTPISIAINGISAGDLPQIKKSRWIENIEPVQLRSRQRSWFISNTPRVVQKIESPMNHKTISSMIKKRYIELRKKYLHSSLN